MPLRQLHKSPFIRDKQLKAMRLTQNQYNWLEREYNKLLKTSITEDCATVTLCRKIEAMKAKGKALSNDSSCTEELWEASVRVYKTCNSLMLAIERKPAKLLF